MFKNAGSIAKLVVAVLGSASASLSVYYASVHWLPVVISVLTAASVYLVPNTPKS